ncbi:hypothetical protein E2562_034470 [Oryza meyeriana var. granulata]|uniref:Uncharacterized protein n=1 Tax=Oryza meyeriana var. granulata TaxID=110450 RepID=A0A6G1ESK9_9ORYZ|nr:hypothetical protein E2562_034470 [Oryza meyeriana var. granulata]
MEPESDRGMMRSVVDPSGTTILRSCPPTTVVAILRRRGMVVEAMVRVVAATSRGVDAQTAPSSCHCRGMQVQACDC